MCKNASYGPYFRQYKAHKYGVKFEEAPEGLWKMFQAEVMSRGMSLKEYEKSLKDKLRNMRSPYKDELLKSLLSIYHDQKTKSLTKRIALVLIMDGRFDLEVVKAPAPWQEEEEEQTRWLTKYEEVTKTKAAKFSGNLDAAIDEATKPFVRGQVTMTGKRGRPKKSVKLN
jgi:hypothetical protein